jgi:hypothetical protein
MICRLNFEDIGNTHIEGAESPCSHWDRCFSENQRRDVILVYNLAVARQVLYQPQWIWKKICLNLDRRWIGNERMK